jgi:DNA helicase HerA-like ATPase
MLWLEDASLISWLPPTLVRLRDQRTGSPHHVFMFGMTGSGKTSSVKKILTSRWIRRPIAVLDWAGEYGDLKLKGVGVSEVSMRGLRPVDVVDAFSSAYELTKPQEAFLLRCLKTATRIREVVERVEEYPVRSAVEAELREALLRRLEPLRSLGLFEGEVGVEELLSSNVRVDLSSLPYEARRLAVNVLLRLMYNMFSRAGPRGAIIVLEEAENVIPARRLEEAPSSGEVILNEVRKWGVSVLAVAQLPSQVSPSTFRNCEYILLHRVQLTPLEASWLGLNEEEVRRLSRLDTGMLLLIHRGSRRWVRMRSRGGRNAAVRSKGDDVKLEVLEGRLEVLVKEVEALQDGLERVRRVLALLPMLTASREGGALVVREREPLEEGEAEAVREALGWLGRVEEAAVDGRRCWFIRR